MEKATPAIQNAAPEKVIIYASSNLVNWEAIFTNPPSLGPVDFAEPVPGSTPQRFYRATEKQ